MKVLQALTLTLIAAHVIVAAPARSDAASTAVINAEVDATFQNFVEQIGGARELANKAAGILVFPSVVKAGMGFGGEYGEGLLLCDQHRSGLV